MFEKLFACLLCLYPPSFRRKYAGEILQLYRDRVRDETGLFRRARLCFDLLADGVTGLPQAYRNSHSAMAAVVVSSNPEGIPSFRILQQEPLRSGSVLIGCFLSLAAIATFSFVISHPKAYRQFSKGAMSPIESVLDRLNRATSTGSIQEARVASPGAESKPAAPSVASIDRKLDPVERDRVIHAVAQNLNRFYVDSQRARSASALILKKAESGDYESFADGQAFAARLTSDLRSATQDPHVEVAYSTIPLPNTAGEPTVAALAEYRSAMLQQNCTFEKIEVLADNIGYLKFDSFPDPAICSSIAKAAMARLNGTDAIIFDLRDNMGGYPGMVEEIAAPLFDHPAPWYNPKEPSGAASSIHSPVPGSRLANKAAYILTSSRTFSGAEQFAYNLKMLKRATLVGETTGGGAHVGIFHRLDDHFGIGIPETPITNPYGGPDWEGIGVHPDVIVRSKDALVVAEKLARNSLHK
jgi:hypothetical protein